MLCLMRSLYLHFPFCESKCHYCDFYSLGRERTRPEDHGQFEAALKKEINQALPLISPTLDTVFLGGGTPSMTAYDSMARALEPLWSKTSLTPQTEWTMEANPSSVNLDSFRLFRGMGINRVSMGVQALKPELLTLLGRVHSREDAIRSLGNLFESGFENVSVDLLCGVPDQSLSDLEKALETLTSFPITHLSCYLLTLPRHHPLSPRLPNEDTQLEHLLFIDRWLTSHGFEHYEISNFAKPGKKARHNLNYWSGKSYLGLGPSAHSFDESTRRRWKNVSSLHRYVKLLQEGKSVEESSETLTPDQRELEKWMLALRLNEGFPEDWLSTPLRQARKQSFLENGLLEAHPQLSAQWRLTPKGFALSDQIIQGFV
jgi:oxygen-independent coproporphyrinogen III oxidase